MRLIVTDYTVFCWIADIVVDSNYRGQGLGKWLMQCMVAHPDISSGEFSSAECNFCVPGMF